MASDPVGMFIPATKPKTLNPLARDKWAETIFQMSRDLEF